MGKQKNKPQIKEQKKSPEKGLNKIKGSNLLDTQFETMDIKMFKTVLYFKET